LFKQSWIIAADFDLKVRALHPRSLASDVVQKLKPGRVQAVDKVASYRFRHRVIPAEAGIQTFISRCYAVIWIPALAGMTNAR